MKYNNYFFLLVFVYVWVLLLNPTSILAHAKPVQTIPAAGASLSIAPKQVRILFSEKILAPTTIKVFDKNKKQVDSQDGKIDPADSKSLNYILSLPDLTDGVYTVEWRSFASDGHTESGKFDFTIKLVPQAQPSATIIPASPTIPATAIAQNATPTVIPIASTNTPLPTSVPTVVPTIAPSPIATQTAPVASNAADLTPVWMWGVLGIGAIGVMLMGILYARRKG